MVDDDQMLVRFSYRRICIVLYREISRDRRVQYSAKAFYLFVKRRRRVLRIPSKFGAVAVIACVFGTVGYRQYQRHMLMEPSLNRCLALF